MLTFLRYNSTVNKCEFWSIAIMNKNIHGSVGDAPAHTIYNKEGIFKICLGVISLILAVFIGIFFGTSFNSKDMYFETTSGLYILGGGIAAAIAAVVVLSLILTVKLAPTKRKTTTLLQYFGGVTLFLLFLQSIIDKNFWIVVFSLIAIAYFIGLFNKHYIANTVFGVGAVLFYGAAIAQTYFDYSIAVNSPYKLLCQIGMAISMLLIASELKFDLGGGNPGAYKLTSALTFILNISASTASLTLIASDSRNIIYCLTPCAAMAIYSAKIFFARPSAPIETHDTQTTPDEKGTDTDEDVN